LPRRKTNLTVKTQPQAQSPPPMGPLPVVPQKPKYQIMAVPVARGMTEDNDFQGFFGGNTGISQLPRLLTFDTLRYMANRSKTFAAILQLRQSQLMDFAKLPQFDGDRGFDIVPRDNQHRAMTQAEAREAAAIANFILNCGLPERISTRDHMSKFLTKVWYDTAVYDATPIELVYTDNGNLHSFLCLDGATIVKTNPQTYLPVTDIGKAVAPISYVQFEPVSEKIVAEFNNLELIYAVRRPTPVVQEFGYGHPELENLVDIITIEIRILTYLDRQLGQGAIPAGLMLLKTPYPRQEGPIVSQAGSGQGAEDIMRAWSTEFAGAQNAGKMAMLQLQPGEEATFINNLLKPQEMQFIEAYEVIQNIIAAHMNTDPAELELVMGSLKESSFIDNDARAMRVRNSKSKGLGAILNFLANDIYNPIIWRKNPDFQIMWRGMDTQTEHERLNYEVELLKNGGSLNEFRRTRNLPLYDTWWANLPMNVVEMIFTNLKDQFVSGKPPDGVLPDIAK
jgi:hypothetical protein